MWLPCVCHVERFALNSIAKLLTKVFPWRACPYIDLFSKFRTVYVCYFLSLAWTWKRKHYVLNLKLNDHKNSFLSCSIAKSVYLKDLSLWLFLTGRHQFYVRIKIILGFTKKKKTEVLGKTLGSRHRRSQVLNNSFCFVYIFYYCILWLCQPRFENTVGNSVLLHMLKTSAYFQFNNTQMKFCKV